MAQLTYTTNPPAGVPGMLCDTGIPKRMKSAKAGDTAGIASGLLAFYESEDVLVAPSADNVPSADADAFKTSFASSGSIQTFTAADMNGVIGSSRLVVARKVDLILSSHANWDATSATLQGYDANGQYITESLSIPDGGNATVTSSNYYSRVTGLIIPAQAGTSGTATLGTNAATGGVVLAAVAGITLRNTAKEGGTVHADKTMIGYLRIGEVWVTSEDATVIGGAVYARFVTSGNEVAGALRATPDGTDCFLIPGLRWASTSSAGIAALEVNLPSG